MPNFKVVFKDNSIKEVEAESKEALIRDFSLADATAFQEKVKEIHWNEEKYCCVETIANGRISKTLNRSFEK